MLIVLKRLSVDLVVFERHTLKGKDGESLALGSDIGTSDKNIIRLNEARRGPAGDKGSHTLTLIFCLPRISDKTRQQTNCASILVFELISGLRAETEGV